MNPAVKRENWKPEGEMLLNIVSLRVVDKFGSMESKGIEPRARKFKDYKGLPKNTLFQRTEMEIQRSSY